MMNVVKAISPFVVSGIMCGLPLTAHSEGELQDTISKTLIPDHLREMRNPIQERGTLLPDAIERLGRCAGIVDVLKEECATLPDLPDLSSLLRNSHNIKDQRVLVPFGPSLPEPLVKLPHSEDGPLRSKEIAKSVADALNALKVVERYAGGIEVLSTVWESINDWSKKVGHTDQFLDRAVRSRLSLAMIPSSVATCSHVGKGNSDQMVPTNPELAPDRQLYGQSLSSQGEVSFPLPEGWPCRRYLEVEERNSNAPYPAFVAPKPIVGLTVPEHCLGQITAPDTHKWGFLRYFEEYRRINAFFSILGKDRKELDQVLGQSRNNPSNLREYFAQALTLESEADGSKRPSFGYRWDIASSVRSLVAMGEEVCHNRRGKWRAYIDSIRHMIERLSRVFSRVVGNHARDIALYRAAAMRIEGHVASLVELDRVNRDRRGKVLARWREEERRITEERNEQIKSINSEIEDAQRAMDSAEQAMKRMELEQHRLRATIQTKSGQLSNLYTQLAKRTGETASVFACAGSESACEVKRRRHSLSVISSFGEMAELVETSGKLARQNDANRRKLSSNERRLQSLQENVEKFRRAYAAAIDKKMVRTTEFESKLSSVRAKISDLARELRRGEGAANELSRILQCNDRWVTRLFVCGFDPQLPS